MVSGSGHGGLGTERQDKIIRFYIRLLTRSNLKTPDRFGSDKSICTRVGL
jgi:hypothetical protein